MNTKEKMRHLVKKHLAIMGLLCVLLTMFAAVASAHQLLGATATANCTGYTLTVTTSNIVAGDFISYSFTSSCFNGPVGGTIYLIPTDNPATQTVSGSWNMPGACTVTGTATLVADGTSTPLPIIINGNAEASLNCAPPQQVCTTGPQALLYNVSEKSSNAGQIVWFNSHLKLQGTVPTTDFAINVTNQTITFGPSTLTVPNGVIRFTSTVTCVSTAFDTATNQWVTTVPLSYATKADEIFAAGLAYMLPAGFSQSVNNVTWHATFTSTAPTLKFQYKYGVANYLTSDGKGNVFPMVGGQPNYNAMLIDPVHNAPTCGGYDGGNHAGTPEAPSVKKLVTGGGSGGGGSNWTGSWSSTPTYICAPTQQ